MRSLLGDVNAIPEIRKEVLCEGMSDWAAGGIGTFENTRTYRTDDKNRCGPRSIGRRQASFRPVSFTGVPELEGSEWRFTLIPDPDIIQIIVVTSCRRIFCPHCPLYR
jgi:hypothetical protein